MPYTVYYCEVTYLRILLCVMLGTRCERCYLLAVEALSFFQTSAGIWF